MTEWFYCVIKIGITTHLPYPFKVLFQSPDPGIIEIIARNQKLRSTKSYPQTIRSGNQATENNRPDKPPQAETPLHFLQFFRLSTLLDPVIFSPVLHFIVDDFCGQNRVRSIFTFQFKEHVCFYLLFGCFAKILFVKFRSQNLSSFNSFYPLSLRGRGTFRAVAPGGFLAPFASLNQRFSDAIVI